MGLAPVLVDAIFDIIRDLHAKGTTILLVEQMRGWPCRSGSRLHPANGQYCPARFCRALRSSELVRKAYLGET